MSVSWAWDTARRARYFWSSDDGCYIYESGLRLDRNGQEVPALVHVNEEEEDDDDDDEDDDEGNDEHPEDQPRFVPQLAVATGNQVAQSPGQSPTYTYASASTVNTYATASTVNSYATASTGNTYTTASTVADSQSQGATPLAYVTQTQEPVERNYQTAADTHYSVLTEPSLAALGPHALRRLVSTAGNEERLDPRFRVRYPGDLFFTLGKIFKVHWPELAALKFRWFAMIKTGQNCCSCLPIQTYGRRGVAKPGVIKGQHAIIYTGREPAPNGNELPAEDEAPMLQSIRVRALTHADRLDKLSRINFAKIYTVEHNVKVYEFGHVHPDSMTLFTGHFRRVWGL